MCKKYGVLVALHVVMKETRDKQFLVCGKLRYQASFILCPRSTSSTDGQYLPCRRYHRRFRRPRAADLLSYPQPRCSWADTDPDLIHLFKKQTEKMKVKNDVLSSFSHKPVPGQHGVLFTNMHLGILFSTKTSSPENTCEYQCDALNFSFLSFCLMTNCD